MSACYIAPAVFESLTELEQAAHFICLQGDQREKPSLSGTWLQLICILLCGRSSMQGHHLAAASRVTTNLLPELNSRYQPYLLDRRRERYKQKLENMYVM